MSSERQLFDVHKHDLSRGSGSSLGSLFRSLRGGGAAARVLVLQPPVLADEYTQAGCLQICGTDGEARRAARPCCRACAPARATAAPPVPFASLRFASPLRRQCAPQHRF